MLAWQVVHVLAIATGSSLCGAWQVTHAPELPWLTLTFWWHPTHAAAAVSNACGSWQLRQTVCAGTVRSASVVLAVWQPVHALSVATKSWAWWQLAQSSCPAGCRSCAWA
jgi:hypothetical protein